MKKVLFAGLLVLAGVSVSAHKKFRDKMNKIRQVNLSDIPALQELYHFVSEEDKKSVAQYVSIVRKERAWARVDMRKLRYGDE